MIENTLVSHCIDFQNQEPGLDSIIEAYRRNLHTVNLGGPTHYGEIFQVINLKQVHHELYYKVCVIITDGEPLDMQ